MRINIASAVFKEVNAAVDERKEIIAMPRHSFIQMTKLHNVMGRIDLDVESCVHRGKIT